MVQINRFESIIGGQVQEIYNQRRFGFHLSEGIELYEIEEVIRYDGSYPGMTIQFYDFETGKVYCPFELKRNVGYGDVRYLNGLYYFLQCDYEARIVNVIEYLPGKEPRVFVSFNMNEVELGNLRIIGNGINIVSSLNTFQSYYPKQFQMDLEPPESVILIDEDKVYCSKWIEEGYDYEKNMQTNDYKYYEQLIIRDLNGNKISEETGNISDHNNRVWLS